MTDQSKQPGQGDIGSESDLSITGFSASTLTRAPLSGQQSRYQSKAFNVNIAVNPLVAAAAPLLTLTSQLANQAHPPTTRELHDALCFEVKAMENKAHSLGYRPQVILAMRYLVCALIDEVIATSSWGSNSDWPSHSLLQTFHNEPWGGDRFFVILERSSEDPATYIDLLELGYICLSLGYRGKYAAQEQMHDLALVIDQLYDIIRHERGEVSRRLLVAPSGNKASAKILQRRWRLPPIWLTALVTVGILTAIFIPYHQKLTNLSQQVTNTLINMGKQ